MSFGSVEFGANPGRDFLAAKFEASPHLFPVNSRKMINKQRDDNINT